MVEQLAPGPELDARVAEKVMGWVQHQPSDRSLATEWVAPDKSTHCPTGTVVHLIDDWSPSTDWRAAGEVMEKFTSSGCHVQINAPGLYSDGTTFATFDAWYCLIQEGACEAAALFTVWGECATGHTGPHAICLAALAACEGGA